LFNILFKLGFIFRVLAVVCLFIAIFGLDFLKFLFKKAKWEIVFAFVYSLFMYWFANFIRGYWLFLSKLVAYSNYALLKISFLQPAVNFSNPSLPFLGVPGFMLGIADTCSGIESLGYFVLAYSALVLINWNQINFKKALLLFVPGLIGTFLVNILRVYLLFIIGIFISRNFALNAYHTNAGMVLFIIYFIVFWPLAMKLMSKKEPVRANQKINKQQRNNIK
jgi:exosortase/archaeosortase family protein